MNTTEPEGPPAPEADSRRPVDPAAIRAALRRPGRWDVRAVTETGSTNADLAAQPATHGAPEVPRDRVLIAELQRSGRGRRGRTWTAPAGAGLTMSVLLAVPEVPAAKRSWIGAVAGLSLVAAVTSASGLAGDPSARVRLKWPNDLLIDGRKAAGLLAEATTSGVVVGIGLNVSLRSEELPRADATSLLLAGASSLDREALAAAVLESLGDWVDRWRAAAGDADRCGLRGAYRDACATVGQRVRLELPAGETVLGVAVDVTVDGELIVETGTGARTFSAADVFHLRPAD